MTKSKSQTNLNRRVLSNRVQIDLHRASHPTPVQPGTYFARCRRG